MVNHSQKITPDVGASKIVNANNKRDTLSVFAHVYVHFSELVTLRWRENENVKNIKERTAGQLCRLEIHGNEIAPHDSLYGFLLLFNMNVDDNPRVLILFIVSNSIKLKGDEKITTSAKGSTTIKNVKYYTVTAVLQQIESSPRLLNSLGAGAVCHGGTGSKNGGSGSHGNSLLRQYPRTHHLFDLQSEVGMDLTIPLGEIVERKSMRLAAVSVLLCALFHVGVQPHLLLRRISRHQCLFVLS